VLEHLYDPWKLLKRIRENCAADTQIIACIPNAQHWSIQARLNAGLFRYEDIGLMDRTHIRWFTKITMIEMFEAAGFTIIEGFPRILNEPQQEQFFRAIRAMAIATGADPHHAANDAMPFQWVVKAVPV